MDSQFADVFLGHPEGEPYRPGVLSNAFDTFTHQVFEEAGLHEGMHVLEIRGSVNGDVAFSPPNLSELPDRSLIEPHVMQSLATALSSEKGDPKRVKFR
jgi:hypothetical protein